MGTRNLTMVINKAGETKIAQYGQWDGSPKGQGVDALNFCSDKENLNLLKEKLKTVRFLDDEGVDEEFAKSYDENAPQWSNEPDKRTDEQKRWWETYITRNLGAAILSNVAESEDLEMILRNGEDFAGDSLFCEWAYVVDFSKNTFEVYEGFNKTPLTKSDRFHNVETEENSEYEPVKMVKSYNLSELPVEADFLADFTEVED